IRGLLKAANAAQRPVWSRRSCSTGPRSAMSPMSAPAAKTLGPPVRTTARTLSSASSSPSAVVISRISSGLSAFRTLGRLSVTTAIGAAMSTRMFSYPIAPYHRLNGEPEIVGLLRAGGRRPEDLGDRPLQLQVHLLHARGGPEMACPRGHPPFRGDRPPVPALRGALRSAHHSHHRRRTAGAGEARGADRDDQLHRSD